MHDAAQCDLVGGFAHAGLVLAASPFAAVLYFLVNQDQFRELLGWAETFLRQAEQRRVSAREPRGL
jgi:hypothetical protein